MKSAKASTSARTVNRRTACRIDLPGGSSGRRNGAPFLGASRPGRPRAFGYNRRFPVGGRLPWCRTSRPLPLPDPCWTWSSASLTGCRTSSAGCAPSGRSTRSRSTRRWTCATRASSWRRWTRTSSRAASTTWIRAFLPLCVQAIQAAVEARVPGRSRRAAGAREPHPQHVYLRNVETLQSILGQAGMRVRVGSPSPRRRPHAHDRSSRRRRNDARADRPPQRRVGLADFDPCMVLLNNDLSSGVPAIFEDLDEPIVPPLAAGGTTGRSPITSVSSTASPRSSRRCSESTPGSFDPYFGVVRQNQLPGARGRGVPRVQCRDAARQDPLRVREVRHCGQAVPPS